VEIVETISSLGSRFKISRSTLLYYDSIGLLSPSARSHAGYRLYSGKDAERLRSIRLFRDLGVPVKLIKAFIDGSAAKTTPMLLKRLLAINEQIDGLRNQQRRILGMIEAEGILKGAKKSLPSHAELGREAGVTENNARLIHRIFQRAAPAEHRRFLRHLGFTDAEIRVFIKKMT
jgi:DNA-binding transcriptional MerR regulator